MVYFDNAATSRKKPIGVYLSLLRENVLSANPGRGGHKAAMRTARKIEEVRQGIRDAFFDGDVVFTKNCTEAINLAVFSALKGKKVITSYSEHTSVLRPLKRLSRQGKINLKIVEPTLEAYRKELDSDTGMVVIGAVSNVTGKINDLERILKEVKARSCAITVVDGAQSAGKVDFDMENVDMFASSGHKGLHGVQGTGFLLIKRGIKLSPIIVGGTGSSSVEIDIPDEIPDGMEAGTVNAPGIVALGAGIKYTTRYKNVLRRREKKLTEYLKKCLSEIDGLTLYSCQNGIVLCNVDGLSAGEVADELSDKYGIYVRSGLHCAPLMHKALGTLPGGAVRISIGSNNHLWHAWYLTFALKKICAESHTPKEGNI